MIIITSIFGGVLPIPGRVALSAPLLDAIAPPDKRKRSEFIETHSVDLDLATLDI